jgi:methionyl-tRNA synthetase
LVIYKTVINPPTTPGGPTQWGIVPTADWIHDGHIYIPTIAGDVVVVVCGTNGPDVVCLYGIDKNGKVVVAQPPQDKANGQRTAKYEGKNQISVTGIGSSYKSRYC